MNSPASIRVLESVRCAGALASIALLLCASAHAQVVRKCQIDGRLVFQSSPCPIEARSTATPPATAPATPPAVVAADPGVAPKKKTLADLLRERDLADPKPSRTREAHGDGSDVLRSRMGAV